MLARRSALVFKSGCVVWNENGDMRCQLQSNKYGGPGGRVM